MLFESYGTALLEWRMMYNACRSLQSGAIGLSVFTSADLTGCPRKMRSRDQRILRRSGPGTCFAVKLLHLDALRHGVTLYSEYKVERQHYKRRIIQRVTMLLVESRGE